MESGAVALATASIKLRQPRMILLQLGEYRAHKIVLKQRSVDHAAVKMDNVDINAARRVFAARRPTDTTLDTFHIALQLSQADAALDN